MKKLSKTAKIIDVIAQVIFALCAVFGAAALIMTVIVNFVGTEFLSEASTVLNLGSVEFTLAPDALPAPVSAKTGFIAGMLFYALKAAFICVIIVILRKILKPMIDQKPFDAAASKNIRSLAWLSLVSGFVMQAANYIGQALMFKTYDIGGLFLGDKITDLQLNISFDETFIVYFAVLYLLSMVFQYGEELQIQSDETL